jgi:hypothetical protein
MQVEGYWKPRTSSADNSVALAMKPGMGGDPTTGAFFAFARAGNWVGVDPLARLATHNVAPAVIVQPSSDATYVGGMDATSASSGGSSVERSSALVPGVPPLIGPATASFVLRVPKGLVSLEDPLNAYVITAYDATAEATYAQGGLVSIDASGELHDTPQTALDLPDAPDTEVRAPLPMPGLPDMYRVPMNPDTHFVQFALSSSSASPTHPDHLLLFDQSGSQVASFALTSDRLVVGVRPVNVASTSQLFVAVSRDQSSDTSAAPSSYVLDVQRVADEGVGIPATDSAAPTLTLSFVTANPAIPLAESSSAGSEEAEVAPGLLVGLGPSQGPLPVTSPAPEGGVFSTGAETVVLRSDSAAAVDLAVLDLWPETQVGYWNEPAAPNSPPAAPWLGIALPVVVPLRGPGGAALWGTSQPTLSPRELARVIPPPQRSGPSGADSVAEETVSPGPIDELLEQQRSLVPTNVVKAGMGVAAVLSLGLVLPDAASLVDAVRRRRLLRPWYSWPQRATRG